ncbi:hypothetical protein LSH36_452g01013 [Paralvinella palmiformis]|uniref:Uncharacterized protein n=1 Tax=Paralvinella palmiformis TaxID=53620 RepID=A0AAD9JAZ4_9ANNE|nr:hypothetical protein LSH36_452g01013 [Paralvinella palmiformis]
MTHFLLKIGQKSSLQLGTVLFTTAGEVSAQKPDESLLAEFFYADEELNGIAAELDSFDGRKNPERCSSLVNQLRQSVRTKFLRFWKRFLNM